MKSTWLKWLSLVLLVTAMVTAGLLLRPYFRVEQLQTMLNDLGIWAPGFFIGAYALATVLFLPGSLLTLVGGFLFGPIWGTLYSLVGATIGASLAFMIARWIASDWVARKVHGRLKALKDGVEKDGWKFVAILRLIPLFPFNALNYALGLTKISLLAFILASFVFMFPGALAYTYLGYLGLEAASGEMGQLIHKIVIALSLIVIVASIPWLLKKWRKTSQGIDKDPS